MEATQAKLQNGMTTNDKDFSFCNDTSLSVVLTAISLQDLNDHVFFADSLYLNNYKLCNAMDLSAVFILELVYFSIAGSNKASEFGLYYNILS